MQSDAKHLFIELEIHRIELELQNEDLKTVRTQLEMAISHSSDLFTEREPRAEAMRASEALFRATSNSASIGITLFGLKGRYLKVNPAFCAMHGRWAARVDQPSAGLEMPLSLTLNGSSKRCGDEHENGKRT